MNYGNTKTYYSEDGLTWKKKSAVGLEESTDQNSWNCMAYHNGIYLATNGVGGAVKPHVFWSENYKDWYPSSPTDPAGKAWARIAVSDDGTWVCHEGGTNKIQWCKT